MQIHFQLFFSFSPPLLVRQAKFHCHWMKLCATFLPDALFIWQSASLSGFDSSIFIFKNFHFCSFCGINFWFWIEYLSHWYNLKMEFIYWIQCWTFEFENLGSEFIWAKPKSNSECFGFWISNQNSSQFRHLSAKNVRFASNGSSIDQ